MNTPRPRLKIVTVCRGGNTRSVAMKMILSRYLGHDCIACGVDSNSLETITSLLNWCDAAVVMEESLVEKLPEGAIDKQFLHLFCVGQDIWGNPFDPVLQAKIVWMLNEYPIFNFGRVIDWNKVQKDLDRYKEKLTLRALGEAAPDLGPFVE